MKIQAFTNLKLIKIDPFDSGFLFKIKNMLKNLSNAWIFFVILLYIIILFKYYINSISISYISVYGTFASWSVAFSCTSLANIRLCLVVVIYALASSIHVCHLDWAFYAYSIISLEGTLFTYTYSLKLIILHIERARYTLVIYHHSIVYAFAA